MKGVNSDNKLILLTKCAGYPGNTTRRPMTLDIPSEPALPFVSLNEIIEVHSVLCIAS